MSRALLLRILQYLKVGGLSVSSVQRTLPVLSVRFSFRFAVLENSERKIVYRALLYSNDFNVPNLLLPKASLGGCYVIPLGISYGSRKQWSSIETISFLACSISTTHRIDFLVPHIWKRASDGFNGEEAKGSFIPIFMDVCVLLRQNWGMSQILVVVKHSAGAPRTLWTYRYKYIHEVPEYSRNQM